MREDTTETVEKVPWFSDLPFFGWFFRRTQERDDTSQLMIFLTPSILPTPLTKAGSIKTANPQRTSRGPSALQKTDRQGAVGSGQEKQQRDQEAKRRAQSDNGQRTTGPLTTETRTTNQPSAKSETQSAQRQQEVAPRANALPADRIW